MVSSATELLLSHSILHPNYYREVNLFEIEYLGVKKAAKSAKSLLTEHRYYYSCYAGTATTMLIHAFLIFWVTSQTVADKTRSQPAHHPFQTDVPCCWVKLRHSFSAWQVIADYFSGLYLKSELVPAVSTNSVLLVQAWSVWL